MLFRRSLAHRAIDRSIHLGPHLGNFSAVSRPRLSFGKANFNHQRSGDLLILRPCRLVKVATHHLKRAGLSAPLESLAPTLEVAMPYPALKHAQALRQSSLSYLLPLATLRHRFVSALRLDHSPMGKSKGDCATAAILSHYYHSPPTAAESNFQRTRLATIVRSCWPQRRRQVC